MIAIILICDDCETPGLPGAARHEMALHAWTNRGDRDRCPECSTEYFFQLTVTYR